MPIRKLKKTRHIKIQTTKTFKKTLTNLIKLLKHLFVYYNYYSYTLSSWDSFCILIPPNTISIKLYYIISQIYILLYGLETAQYIYDYSFTNSYQHIHLLLFKLVVLKTVTSNRKTIVCDNLTLYFLKQNSIPTLDCNHNHNKLFSVFLFYSQITPIFLLINGTPRCVTKQTQTLYTDVHRTN